MPVAPEAQKPSAAGATPPVGRYRWRMLALIFFATTINYMDRTVLTVLAPILQYRVFHWTDADYATVTMAFQAAYAIGLVAMGAILDRLGTRIGYAISIVIWSVFDLLHATVRPSFSAIGFPLVRFGFGFGQAGTYPAAVKSVGEWFPRKERALATGIFNAGSNMGAILAPLFVPLVVSSTDGAHWQFAFLAMGALSAGCALLWWKLYRRPEECAGLGAGERNYISSDVAAESPNGAKLRWRAILPLPETWAFAVSKTTDVAWWFYSFWVGKFFFDQYGLSIKTLAVPLMIIFVSADIGSVGGGWLSSHLLKRGWTVNRARKSTMLLCALCALPVGLSTHLGTHFQLTSDAVKSLAATATSEAGPTKLQILVGKDFRSAKEFLAGVDGTIGLEERRHLEPTLLAVARSDGRYWIAVCLIALAAAAHQGWSATIFTVVTDVFPKKATGSVVGFGGMVGALAGVTANYALGHALMSGGSTGYSYMFLAAGCSYLVVLGVVQLLTPRLEPVVLV
jgi:MFS transporter, ACS family, hexuronate transporter